MKILSKHHYCGTYREEGSLCNYCLEQDLPWYKFYMWAHDAYWLYNDWWKLYDEKVANYITTHTVKELSQ